MNLNIPRTMITTPKAQERISMPNIAATPEKIFSANKLPIDL